MIRLVAVMLIDAVIIVNQNAQPADSAANAQNKISPDATPAQKALHLAHIPSISAIRCCQSLPASNRWSQIFIKYSGAVGAKAVRQTNDNAAAPNPSKKQAKRFISAWCGGGAPIRNETANPQKVLAAQRMKVNKLVEFSMWFFF